MLSLTFTQQDLIREADAWLVETYGILRDLPQDAQDRWFHHKGLLAAFVRHLFRHCNDLEDGLRQQDLETIRQILATGGTRADVAKFLATPPAP